MPKELEQRRNFNPYRRMSLDELRDLISNSYKSKTIKEIDFENPKLAHALNLIKFNGKRAIGIFYDEHLLSRLRRPAFFFKKMGFEEILSYTESNYSNHTTTRLYEIDQSLARYLAGTFLNERSYMDLLVEKGILHRPVIERPASYKSHGAKWRALNSRVTSPKGYRKEIF